MHYPRSTLRGSVTPRSRAAAPLTKPPSERTALSSGSLLVLENIDRAFPKQQTSDARCTVLPHFAGIFSIFSKRQVLMGLLLLQTRCILCVLSEPLAYEWLLPFAWKTLPVSEMRELSGVLVFGINIAGV